MKLSLIYTEKQRLNKVNTPELLEKARKHWKSLSFKEKLKQARENGKGYFKFDGDLFARF